MSAKKITDPTEQQQEFDDSDVVGRPRTLFSIYLGEDGKPHSESDSEMTDLEQAYVVALAWQLVEKLAGAERPPSNQLPC